MTVTAWGSAFVGIRAAGQTLSPGALALGRLVVSTAILGGFAPPLVTEVAKADPAAIGWTIYLGSVPTALGFTTWAFALRRASAGRTASLNYLIPVVAIVLGWAVLSQTPPWLAVAGGALCLFGVYLARRRAANDEGVA